MELEHRGDHPAEAAYDEYFASDVIEAIANDRVVVGIRRDAENILSLDETVPTGKKWSISVTINVFESDA